MPAVKVLPETFSMVEFDADRIRELASELLDKIGLDRDLTIEVDETVPFARSHVTSTDPLVVQAESGAFEDNKRPRELSDEAVTDSLGKLLLRVQDRLSGRFDDTPDDDEITLAHLTAWDAFCLGRLARLGYHDQSPRRRYHFRNRHGFTDAADQAFDTLWNADELSWAEIIALSDEALAAAPVPPPGAYETRSTAGKRKLPQRS